MLPTNKIGIGHFKSAFVWGGPVFPTNGGFHHLDSFHTIQNQGSRVHGGSYFKEGWLSYIYRVCRRKLHGSRYSSRAELSFACRENW